MLPGGKSKHALNYFSILPIVNINLINADTGMEIHPTSETFALLQFQVDSEGRKIQVLRFLQDGLLKVIMKVNDALSKALFEPDKSVS